MGEIRQSIWIANHVFLDRARFLRQRLHKILLSSQAKALINIAGAAFWLAEAETSHRNPAQGERLPDAYSDVFLFHLRNALLIRKEDILGYQGIQYGDVCVFFRGDKELCSIQNSLVAGEPEFPLFISGDLGPEKDLFSYEELVELSDSTQEEAPREHIKEIIPQGGVIRGEMGEPFPRREDSVRKGTLNEKEYKRILTVLGELPDLPLLADELARFRQENAGVYEGPENTGILRHVALAEIAARAGETKITLEYFAALSAKRPQGGISETANQLLAVLEGALQL